MQIEFRPFQTDDADQIVALWQVCGLIRPWNDPYKDIQRKLDEDPSLFRVAVCDTQVIGSVMAGFDGHRGWIYYLAVLPQYQSRGLGKRLVQDAEERLCAIGCPKIQLMIRQENNAVNAFYQTLGYEPADVLVLGKRLIADE